MHVYFYAAAPHPKNAADTYRAIRDVLAESDCFVSTNTADQEVQVSSEVMAETRSTGTPLLERMDAFILEGTSSDPQVGFLLAHAIALKKPTLYLYRKGTVPQIFSHLNYRDLPPHVAVLAYADGSVDDDVRAFMGKITGKKIRQVPRIKFTLRITTAIEEYLHFKTHNTSISKADYLREQIERDMESDEEWQRYQRRRRE